MRDTFNYQKTKNMSEIYPNYITRLKRGICWLRIVSPQIPGNATYSKIAKTKYKCGQIILGMIYQISRSNELDTEISNTPVWCEPKSYTVSRFFPQKILFYIQP